MGAKRGSSHDHGGPLESLMDAGRLERMRQEGGLWPQRATRPTARHDACVMRFSAFQCFVGLLMCLFNVPTPPMPRRCRFS